MNALYMSNALRNLWLWHSFSSLQLLRSFYVPNLVSWWRWLGLIVDYLLIPVVIEKVEKKDLIRNLGPCNHSAIWGPGQGKGWMGHH